MARSKQRQSEDRQSAEARIEQTLGEAREVADELAASADVRKKVAEAARLVTKALMAGRKVLFCGNGGSAADSQHIAAELVGRFKTERAAMAAIALTTDTSILTSIANDYGYPEVFRRQVEALGARGDVLVALSTSGNAENILRAVEQAKRQGLATVGMTGSAGGELSRAVDIAVCVPSDLPPRIQECHSIIGHALCEVVEQAVSLQAAARDKKKQGRQV